MKLHELFPEISLNPASAKDIKQWILQLAVEGKLTKKWREENKSKQNDQLLNEIIDYNFKAYKVKPSKEIKSVNTSKYPSTWNPVKTKDIITLRKGKNPKDLSEQIKRFPYLDIEALDRNNIRRWSDDEKVPMCTSNDILVVCDGSRSGLILQGSNGILGSTLAIIQTYPPIQSYVKILFQALFKELNTSMKGAAIPHLDTKALSELTIGLPPLEEQQAIVTIVEDLFKEVADLVQQATQRIELKRSYAQSALKRLCEADTTAEWKQLVSVFPEIFNDKQTIKTLRETILQLAVQGKLTAKWRGKSPSLSSASELLEQIKAEKAQLIKEKKIKAEKPLPKIEAEEIPFELPVGWVWCRMQDIGLFDRGKSKHRPRNDFRLFHEGTIPLVQTGDVSSAKYNNGKIISHKTMYNDFGLSQSKIWPKGTLCITIAANIAETGFLTYDACFPDSIVGFQSLVGEYLPSYLEYFIATAKADLEKYAPSTAQKNINLGILYELKFPLPSEYEQQFIVEKVNALMGLCDELEMVVEKREKLLGKLAIA